MMELRVERVNLAEAESRLSEMLCFLPVWRREKALSYLFLRDRYLCARSFLLLQEMVREEFGLAELPAFAFGGQGKPYFREYPGIHFSISHCPVAIACAVGDMPVGVDVEGYSFDEKVAELALSPSEFNQVRVAEHPGMVFAKYWTMKESLLKLRGCGIGEDMRGLLGEYSDKVEFQIRDIPESGYITTVATWKHL